MEDLARGGFNERILNTYAINPGGTFVFGTGGKALQLRSCTEVTSTR
jgi:hypothetical protein